MYSQVNWVMCCFFSFALAVHSLHSTFIVRSRCWPILHHFGGVHTLDSCLVNCVEGKGSRLSAFFVHSVSACRCTCLSSSRNCGNQCTARRNHRQFLILAVPISTENGRLCLTFKKAVKLKWHFHIKVFSCFRQALSKWITVNSLNLFFCWTFPCTYDRIAERPLWMKLGLYSHVHR